MSMVTALFPRFFVVNHSLAVTRTVLVFDIGGTRLRVAILRLDPGSAHAEVLSVQILSTKSCPNPLSAIQQVVRESGVKPDCGCGSIAGPVQDGCVLGNNLPPGWGTLDEREFTRVLGFPVKFINDFAAVALVAKHDCFQPEGTIILKPGVPVELADMVVLAPEQVWANVNFATIRRQECMLFAPGRAAMLTSRLETLCCISSF